MIHLIIALNFFLTTPYNSDQYATVAETNFNRDNVLIQDRKKKNKQALFIYHFKILDSVVNSNPNDTIYGGSCFRSILFMVKNTKIEVTADVSGIMGRTNFNRSDWVNWHEWYEKRYGKKKAIKKIRTS